MQVVFLVLNKVECLEELLVDLADAGVKGGTIIESTGMAKVLGDSEDLHVFGRLRMLFDPARVASKTLFFVLEDEQVETVRAVINGVLGGLDQPNTGILFGMPVSFVEGMGHYSQRA